MTHSPMCFHGNGRKEGRVSESECTWEFPRGRSWEKRRIKKTERELKALNCC